MDFHDHVTEMPNQLRAYKMQANEKRDVKWQVKTKENGLALRNVFVLQQVLMDQLEVF